MTDPNLTTTEDPEACPPRSKGVSPPAAFPANVPAAIVPLLCPYCGHDSHPAGVKCSECKCKAKPKFWSNLGNALGEALFGGNR